MNRLFASDLHLEDPDGRHFRAFERLLDTTDADEIYLLGDLCEVWIGDDDDGPLARRFVAALAAAGRHADVHVMSGNRDFLFGERFAAEAGVRLLTDPVRLDDGLLLTHGDAFCIDDEAYQATRLVLRSAGAGAGQLLPPPPLQLLVLHHRQRRSRRACPGRCRSAASPSATAPCTAPRHKLTPRRRPLRIHQQRS